jgi:Short-chain dehydrogenases of various substrate specificities
VRAGGRGDRAAHGVRAIGLRCDVRSAAEIEAVVERTVTELGSIDVLVNNAGTSWGASVEEYPLEGWQKVIDVNLTGLFQFTQLAGRTMIAQGHGKVVNVASVAAFGGAPPELMDAVAYNASKGGVVASHATWRSSGPATASPSTRSRRGGSRRR